MSNKVENFETLRKSDKKFFNKKVWRKQKYSCKAKVQNWDNIKRMQAERKLNKEHKTLKTQFGSTDKRKNLKQYAHKNNLKEAGVKYKQLQVFKKKKKEEQDKIKQQKIEAIKLHKQKKVERYKKLCQKTKTGQPLMRGRIELMLEKIQNMVSKLED